MSTKVLLLGEITEDLKNLLNTGKYEVNSDSTQTDYQAILVRGGIPVTKELIDSNSQLQLIISAGIGVDNIDLVAAAAKNIIVANCPLASAVSTAEHSLALMLAGIKKIGNANQQLKQGEWNRVSNVTSQFLGKTVGVVGLGRIGSHVASLYKAIGFKVLAYDPYLHNYQFQTRQVERVEDLKDLCSRVNYLSLHVAKTKYTTDLITAEHLDLLQNPSGIVNTCRGGVVSEELVIEYLQKGKLGFYAADVFESEPNLNPELAKRADVIATPHIAANSVEAQTQIAQDAYIQLHDFFSKQLTPVYALTA